MTNFYIEKKNIIHKNFLDKIMSSNFNFFRTKNFLRYMLYSNKTQFDFKLDKKNKDLIIGAVYGMKPASLTVFLSSIRKFYNGDIILVGIKSDKRIFKKYCEKYKCNFLIDDNNPLNGFINRYKIYKKILNKFKFKKNILLSDTRDVYFQKNPFKIITSNKIYIGSEKNIFFVDNINSYWVNKFYNSNVLFKMKNEKVLCSGVILGKLSKLKNFIDLLIKEHQNVLHQFRFNSLSFPRGSDNTTVNYCYYNLCNKNDFIISSAIGKNISTFAALDNSEIKLKNNIFVSHDNKIISIVHQYDRFFEIKKK